MLLTLRSGQNGRWQSSRFCRQWYSQRVEPVVEFDWHPGCQSNTLASLNIYEFSGNGYSSWTSLCVFPLMRQTKWQPVFCHPSKRGCAWYPRSSTAVWPGSIMLLTKGLSAPFPSVRNNLRGMPLFRLKPRCNLALLELLRYSAQCMDKTESIREPSMATKSPRFACWIGRTDLACF